MKYKSMAAAKEMQADAMIPRHPAGYQMLAKGASNRLPRAGLIFHETLWTAQTFTWVIVLLKRCNY